MIDQNRHIVSRVQWETSLNEKEFAQPLQSEISSWSKLKLEGEINRIFDALCPSDQVWKINSLVLDLGSIDYTNLHGDLTKKFAKELSEQLKELLFYSSDNIDKIEIVNQSTSNLSLLKNYLLNGYLPWSYSSEIKNIDQLLNDLLETNKTETIYWLRSNGKENKIRKRISWQLKDHTLTKIVAGLEPNNHQQIVEFRDQFITIQKEENIVKSNVADFSKEAWYWILSYLLVDRGSLFNKLTFMKSMLVKMAAKYNFGYNDLIVLIERAIEKIAIASHIQSDFITTLTIISNESLSERQKIEQEKVSSTNYWNLLEIFLSDNTEISSQLNSVNVNDLISNLSQRNNTEFVSWLLQVKKDFNKWSKLLLTINKTTYTVLINAIAPSQSNFLIATLKVMHKILKKSNSGVSDNEFWRISIDYLIENKNSRINTKSYTKHLVQVLSTSEKQTTTNLLSQFVALKNWTVERSKYSINLYEELNTLYNEEIGGNNTHVLKQRISELFHKIDHNYVYNTKESILINESMIRWVQTNPKEFFETILDYENKERLLSFLNTYLTNLQATIIVEKLDTPLVSILFKLKNVLKELEKNQKLNRIIKFFEDNLMLIGLQKIIINPKNSSILFIQEILTQASRTMNKEELRLFSEVIDRFFSHKKLIDKEFTETTLSGFKNKFQKVKDQDILIRTHSLIVAKGSKRNEIGDFLLNNFEDEIFSAARISDSDDLIIILNYLLEKGSALKTPITTEAIQKLTNGKNNFSKENGTAEVVTLFWKCVLSYREHQGNIEKFKTLFNQSIAFYYHRNPSMVISSKYKTNQHIQLKSGTKITPSLLLMLVSKGIESAVLTVKEDNLTIDLPEALPLILDIDAAGIKQFLSKIAITDQRIRNLIAVISFSEFCLLISATTHLKSFLLAIKSLQEIVSKMGTKELEKILLIDYWKLTWKTIQNTRVDAISFSKLVQQSIFEIAKVKNIKGSDVLEEITSNTIPVNNMLKEALIKVHQVFELIPDEKTTKNSLLAKCENNGLLEELVISMLVNKSIPAWYSGIHQHNFKVTLNELMTYHPVLFLKIFKYKITDKEDKIWVCKKIDAAILVKEISQLNPNHSIRLSMLLKMYYAFSQLTIGPVSGSQLQLILLEKILMAWSTNYWQLLSTEKIWKELMWEMCTKRGVTSVQFLKVIEVQKSQFPSALQVTLGHLLIKKETPSINKTIISKKVKEVSTIKKKLPMINEGIAVKNAGLVLLADYIKILFDRLGLLEDEKIKDPETQIKAVHYLQYVVTGLVATEEFLLPLNKVICGLDINDPITAGIEINKEEEELIDGLLNAVINYWPAIGSTSVNGFRGNWLIRDGILTEQEDKWELVVEKRAYDILINKSPFAFSIIKYPWMEKAIHVTWPY